jgi:ABC-type Na+ efflux pump permease subunit
VISIIVGVSATLTGVYLMFLSVLVFFGYGVTQAPNAATGLLAALVLCVALGLFYVVYRSFKADLKKSPQSPDVR